MFYRCLVLAGLSLSLLCGAAAAHEGHEHEAEPEASATSASISAARLALQSPRVELVAARQPAALLIYLDDYDSNAPLKDLRVQLRIGTRLVQAQADAAGVYRVADDLLPEEAQEVEFLLQGEGWQEQLRGLLPGEVPVEEVQASTSLRPWIFIALAVVIGGVVLVWASRRRSR